MEQLTWHDGTVNSVHYDESARRLVWQVEVFRWDVGHVGDAVAGEAVFEDVRRIEALHDVVGEASPAPRFWDVLGAWFERVEGIVRCRFSLGVPHKANERGGLDTGKSL